MEIAHETHFKFDASVSVSAHSNKVPWQIKPFIHKDPDFEKPI